MMPTSPEPVNISEYLSQGREYQKQGNIENSIESYQKALELNPNLVPALSKLGKIHCDRKEYETAFSYYLKLIVLKPKKSVFFQRLLQVSLNYGKLLLKTNDLDRAIIAYEQFFQQKLSQTQTLDKIDKICNNFGEVLLKLSVRQGQFATAIACCQKAVDKYPHKEWSYYHLGNMLAKQKKRKLDEAIAFHEKALEIRPDFYLSLVQLGKLFLRKGYQDRAFQCGIKILESKGHFPGIKLSNDLVKLLSVDSGEKSKQALEQAIEKVEKPDSKPGSKITTYMNVGKILRDRGQFEEAAEFYQKCVYHRLQKLKPEFVERYWEKGSFQSPDFLILGFAKCGTTAFYDYLCQHPQVLQSIQKEPFSLSQLVQKTNNFAEKDWTLSPAEKKWYLAHFAPRPEGKKFITGEASTSNIIPGVEQIVASWFPNIKIIVLIREPVRRTISHYEQRLKNNRQRGSLKRVLNSELGELQGINTLNSTVIDNILRTKGWNAHIAMSLYVYPLERWMQLFSKEQFLILTNEDLAQYPGETMKQAFGFLELPECNSIQYNPRNVGSYPQINDQLLSRLSEFFQPHNQRLEEFLGRKFDWNK